MHFGKSSALARRMHEDGTMHWFARHIYQVSRMNEVCTYKKLSYQAHERFALCKSGYFSAYPPFASRGGKGGRLATEKVEDPTTTLP